MAGGLESTTFKQHFPTNAALLRLVTCFGQLTDLSGVVMNSESQKKLGVLCGQGLEPGHLAGCGHNRPQHAMRQKRPTC